jgi:hypothetical protein
MQFAAELDGSSSVSWAVSLRVRDGMTHGYLKSYFAKVEEHYEGIPTLGDVKPRIRRLVAEVSERRRKVGEA